MIDILMIAILAVLTLTAFGLSHWSGKVAAEGREGR